jgi:hypothetical protein
MRRRRVLALAATAAGTATAGCLGGAFGSPAPDTGEGTPSYERTTVTVLDGDGTELATVRVRIADTREKRYLGLSATGSLGEDEGMLFVHDSEGEYAYVMREMDFPLDIVFVGADRVITRIHHAPLPPEGTSGGDLTRYRGRGKYVLEVPKGYTTDRGIEAGHRLRIAADV